MARCQFIQEERAKSSVNKRFEDDLVAASQHNEARLDGLLDRFADMGV